MQLQGTEKWMQRNGKCYYDEVHELYIRKRTAGSAECRHLSENFYTY